MINERASPLVYRGVTHYPPDHTPCRPTGGPPTPPTPTNATREARPTPYEVPPVPTNGRTTHASNPHQRHARSASRTVRSTVQNRTKYRPEPYEVPGCPMINQRASPLVYRRGYSLPSPPPPVPTSGRTLPPPTPAPNPIFSGRIAAYHDISPTPLDNPSLWANNRSYSWVLLKKLRV